MDRYRKIKVLVVDDSLLFRESIIRMVSSDPQIEIVAVASNPFEARDRILEKKPDVITCDVDAGHERNRICTPSVAPIFCACRDGQRHQR